MKVYGALELAQLEWFLDSAKPSAASFIYRVIYVSDLKQIQVSDGTNWIPFLNTSTNQTLSGDITFSGQQIFNGLHRLSVTTNSATGAIVALAPTTPITEFTGAVTSVSGITSGASGATVMLINRSGSPFTVLDEDTGATAGDRIRTGTGSSITLTNNASILLSYAGDSRWHVVGGTGSSSAGGAKNYFAISSANPNFSQNSVSPWSACTLTFTSGVPSGAPTLTATQMAIAPTPTNPLLQSQSAYNLQLVKSGAAQYQGFISGELTIDREDLAKVLTGSFSYEVVTGPVNFSGTSTQDLEIWVYNTVSGAWTQPAGYRGMNTSSGVGVVSFTFQTDSTAANNKYKIAVITQQTSATGYTVNFNDFSVGPTVVINGTPVTDWQTFTPTVGFNNATHLGKYRRVGDSVEVSIQTTFTAAPTTGTLSWNMPTGLSVDTSKIDNSNNRYVGGVAYGAGSQQAIGNTYYSTTSNAWGIQGISTTSSFSFVVPITWTTGNTINLFYRIPVQGWSSNVQISSDTDTRVVAFRATRATAQSMPHNPSPSTTIQFDSIKYDSHSSWDSTNFLYRVPVSGVYEIYGELLLTFGGNFGEMRADLLIDGSNGGLAQNNRPSVGGSTNLGLTYGFQRYLNAGQTIQIRFFQNNTGSGSLNLLGDSAGFGDVSSLYINRLSGPSVIAASETVAASYSASTSASSSTSQAINFDLKEYDTHNAVTPGVNWRYTAPVSGTYLVSIYVNATAGTPSYFNIYKNSTSTIYKSIGYATTTTVGSGATSLKLNAGDYIGIYTSASFPYFGNASLNTQNTSHITIIRTGN
jgi:hypothetical protein